MPTDETFKPHFKDHMWALAKKRWHYMRTRSDMVLWEYLVPLFLIALVVWQSTIFIAPSESADPLEMSLQEYTDVKVLYRIGAESGDLVQP